MVSISISLINRKRIEIDNDSLYYDLQMGVLSPVGHCIPANHFGRNSVTDLSPIANAWDDADNEPMPGVNGLWEWSDLSVKLPSENLSAWESVTGSMRPPGR